MLPVELRELRELRELVPYRKSLVRERAAESNRIQKVLEGAHIKLASVATRVLGLSGRAMVEALISGVTDPTELADLARGRLKTKQAELVGDVLSIPDGILLCTRKDGNRLGQLRVGWQRPMRCPVGAQDVRQRQGIDRIDLPASATETRQRC